MTQIFILAIEHFASVGIDEKCTVWWEVIFQPGVIQSAVLSEIVVGFIDTFATCISLSGGIKIISLSGFCSIPSGDDGTIFWGIVVFSLIREETVAVKIALCICTEVVFLTVYFVESVPALAGFIEIAEPFVNAQILISGIGFVCVAIIVVASALYNLSGLCFLQLGKRKSRDGGRTCAESDQQNSQNQKQKVSFLFHLSYSFFI